MEDNKTPTIAATMMMAKRRVLYNSRFRVTNCLRRGNGLEHSDLPRMKCISFDFKNKQPKPHRLHHKNNWRDVRRLTAMAERASSVC
jgi:hypothetical protein